MRAVMPFSAIVGQDQMKLALILAAIDPSIGGVLIRGERGTAKSTAARALAGLLPKIRVLTGSPYNDDPDSETSWSDWARARKEADQPLSVSEMRTPFVELPVGATEDRVVGTFKLAPALREGRREFEPGVLAAAHRGLLYIDEVNLLDDHIVDVLLDAAAMGVNRIEREGVSFQHPARFILVGTMNPEEGELRPQLLDRFAFSVTISRVAGRAERLEIMRRNLDFERDPDGFRRTWAASDEDIRTAITQARTRLGEIELGEQDFDRIAEVVTGLNMEGHRGELALARAARAHAALMGRRHIDDLDIVASGELVLPHRVHTARAGAIGMDARQARRVVEDIVLHGLTADEISLADYLVDRDEDQAGQARQVRERPEPLAGDSPVTRRQAGEAHEASAPRLPTTDKPAKDTARTGGRSRGRSRTTTETDSSRGRQRGARPADGRGEIDLDATIKAAADKQPGRRQQRKEMGMAVALESEDLHKKVRVRPVPSLVLFVLDGSKSVSGDNRVELAKGTILALLQEAYQRRDRIGLIVFGDNKAEVILRPTHSIDLGRKALETLTVGGNTPLSAGLRTAVDVFREEHRLRPEGHLVMVLFSDGQGNVSATGRKPQAEVGEAAEELRALGVQTVLINLEVPNLDFGDPKRLADQLQAEIYPLGTVSEPALRAMVRRLQKAPAAPG